MMIYDCFNFYREFDLLEIRLHELADVVDKHVLVEATHTFQGQPKPLYFEENKTRFAPFLDKIVHIVVDDLPLNGNTWDNEFHQRDQIRRGIQDCKDDDVIIIGEADEIAKPAAIRVFRDSVNELRALACKQYSYFLNWLSDFWIHPKILRYGEFKAYHSYASLISIFQHPPLLYNGGWHFTWLGGIAGIQEKLQTYSHKELNTEKCLDPEHIRQCIEQGIHFLNPNIRYKLVPIDGSFPKYVQENQDRFRHLIWPPTNAITVL
jgi:beta-1,4-mannosyl-glycoprotein beta-1,4-N-acetylglucosaminyltransferase